MSLLFSWMDIIVLLVFLTMVWSASLHTVLGECFRLLTVFLSVFISLFFYPDLSVLLQKTLIFQIFPDTLAILSLFIGVYFLCFWAREGWMILMKVNEKEKNTLGLSVWISLPAAALVSGQILIACLLLKNSYTEEAFQHSMTGRLMVGVPLTVYQAVTGAFSFYKGSDDKSDSSHQALLDIAGFRKVSGASSENGI